MVNQKGVSTIVVTVILVALSLVAVGVVWAVVSGVIGSSTEGAEISSKCLNVEIRATSADCTNPAACVVKLERTGTGDDVVSGVKMVFENAAGARSAASVDSSGDVLKLVGRTATVASGIAATVNKVEVTTYFTDASGNEKLCQQTYPFSF